MRQITLLMLALSLFATVQVVHAVEYGVQPVDFPGITQEDIDAYTTDLMNGGVGSAFSLFQLTTGGETPEPVTGLQWPLGFKEAAFVLTHFPGGHTEHTFEQQSPEHLYGALLRFAIAYGGENMLRHMRTIKRMFVPKWGVDLIEDWQAYSGSYSPEEGPEVRFYLFINPRYARGVYVELTHVDA